MLVWSVSQEVRSRGQWDGRPGARPKVRVVAPGGPSDGSPPGTAGTTGTRMGCGGKGKGWVIREGRPHTKETLRPTLHVPSCSPYSALCLAFGASFHSRSLSQNDVTVYSLGWIFLCCRNYPGPCELFGGILDLGQLDTRSTPQIVPWKKCLRTLFSVT